ncbi:hypothetical protein BCR34DRAFT_471976 [Clohesyomyces aquaticus]|uniref:DUF1264-domain-containing protein n=1 Tax=Clohesyomyces aquaticus TaxID=1231657 RepID=A0A1Y2AB45_9PLEO|nr:hypothetical protein BCR34DRAFT_471976 [Clohesyomyces aquaticus]
MNEIPTTNQAPGDALSTENKVLTTGAAAVQNFDPVNNICAHLNAFHAYADEPGRCVEANHYCSHLNEDVRQCILYDSPTMPARLIGIGRLSFPSPLPLISTAPCSPEYMITPRLFTTLSPSEQKLWHSHVYEVKSGMLIMPKPPLVPETVWEAAENKEMEQVVHLYGKVYHLWQVDRGDQLPLGEPKLMTSFTKDGQMPGFEDVVGKRDRRMGSDWRRKKEVREYIQEREVHENADAAWKK